MTDQERDRILYGNYCANKWFIIGLAAGALAIIVLLVIFCLTHPIVQ